MWNVIMGKSGYLKGSISVKNKKVNPCLAMFFREILKFEMRMVGHRTPEG